MTVVLFWDIDGTLLTTARAGIFALEAAAREVCGGQPDYSELRTAGLTDSEVAELSIREVGIDPELAVVSRFLRVYERELPHCLHLRQGRILPGVREILDDLARCDDVRLMLLTGNTEAGAAAKLRHYGLARYFEGGAFCRDGDDRETIARRALEIVGGRTEGVYVIGDTPHDVRCGDAIGVSVLAVAGGTYTLRELQACGAWKCVDTLPDPAGFRHLVGLSSLP